MKKYFVLVLLLMLSSCAVTPPKNSAYLIKSIPASVPVKHQQSSTILVMPPNTAPLYNTRNMAYSNFPYKISYYVKNSWAESPSNMLQPLIVKTLQKTHRYKAVLSAPYPGSYNYLLTTEITELLQDFTGCVPMLKFGFRAQLSDGVTGRIIRVKEFNRSVPMRREDPYAGVLAANEAVAGVLRELAEWVV